MVCAEAVLTFFKRLQWDSAISQAMLHSVGIVLERCSDSVALDFVQSLTRAPALISPLQVWSDAPQKGNAPCEHYLVPRFVFCACSHLTSLLMLQHVCCLQDIPPPPESCSMGLNLCTLTYIYLCCLQCRRPVCLHSCRP